MVYFGPPDSSALQVRAHAGWVGAARLLWGLVCGGHPGAGSSDRALPAAMTPRRRPSAPARAARGLQAGNMARTDPTRPLGPPLPCALLQAHMPVDTLQDATVEAKESAASPEPSAGGKAATGGGGGGSGGGVIKAPAGVEEECAETPEEVQGGRAGARADDLTDRMRARLPLAASLAQDRAPPDSRMPCPPLLLLSSSCSPPPPRWRPSSAAPPSALPRARPRTTTGARAGARWASSACASLG